MERARRLVRSHRHHHGRLCVDQVQIIDPRTSAGSQGRSGFCHHGICRSWSGRIFWRHDQQARACERRFHNPLDGRKPLNPSPQQHEPIASPSAKPSLPNGSAAAILSAGVGCFALSVFAVVADASRLVAKFFTFYLQTGPLSGVTTTAILLWLIIWFVLATRWRTRAVAIAKVNATAFALLALGILLTFPPFSGTSCRSGRKKAWDIGPLTAARDIRLSIRRNTTAFPMRAGCCSATSASGGRWEEKFFLAPPKALRLRRHNPPPWSTPAGFTTSRILDCNCYFAMGIRSLDKRRITPTSPSTKPGDRSPATVSMSFSAAISNDYERRLC